MTPEEKFEKWWEESGYDILSTLNASIKGVAREAHLAGQQSVKSTPKSVRDKVFKKMPLNIGNTGLIR